MAIAVSELMPITDRLCGEHPWLGVAKYFFKVDSTQNRITQWLTKEADKAVLVIAETQSKGVGRHGRPWTSPAGGLWFTLGLSMGQLTPAQVGSFSVVTALQVTRSLKEVNNLECSIKWPNDIIYGDKKLGGILLTTTAKFKKPWMLIGVGINVNNELPSDLTDIATSIKLIRGQSQGRTRLLESLLNSIWQAWVDFPKTGFGPYQKAVESLIASTLGKPVQVRMGNRQIQGVLVGVDPHGSLLLQSDSGPKTVHAGEIVGLPS